MYYLDGVTITTRQTHTDIYTLCQNYNEGYNHYLVTASSSTIIGIQGHCWHLSGSTHAGVLRK